MVIEAEATDEDVPVGSLLGGRFRVQGLLGRGGMAAVFRARHELTGRSVALKVAAGKVAHNRVLAGRFMREARAATALRHPHAIEVIDAFEDDGRPVMVMELLEGEDLGSRLHREGALTVEETAAIFVPVLSALAHAHAKGIVHRDLKPDNIYLAWRNGEVVPKVLDFGIAKVVGDIVDPETMNLTTTGTLLGTPYYMSPEQVSGRDDVDHRTDLWSLGVVLYEALSGRLPFEGQNFGQVFAAILQASPQPIARAVPAVPEALAVVIERCLEKDRERRVQSCGEVAAALVPHADSPRRSFPPPSVPPGGRRGATSAVYVVAPDAADEDRLSRMPTIARSGGVTTERIPRRPRAALLAAIVGAVVALCIAIAWALASRSPEPSARRASEETRLEDTRARPTLEQPRSDETVAAPEPAPRRAQQEEATEASDDEVAPEPERARVRPRERLRVRTERQVTGREAPSMQAETPAMGGGGLIHEL